MFEAKPMSFLIVGLLTIGCLSWATPAASVEAPETWTATGSLGTSRRHAGITQLPNGKTLVVGGVSTTGPDLFCNTAGNCSFFATAELYDPIAGTWSATGGLTTGGRALHTTTLLQNGKVLVAGGFDPAVGYFTSAELYDPATGLFTATGSMSVARSQHTATLLDNGKVLVVGGFETSGPLASAELYDPGTGAFTLLTGVGQSLTDARNTHTATRLPSGKVLIVGGFGTSTLATAELFDPATNTFSATGSLAVGRGSHRAGILTNGKVLVSGGNNGAALTSTEIFDPNASAGVGAFTGGPSLSQARQWHNGALLPSGEVLIAGGNNNASGHWDVHTNFLSSVELYDPITNTFSSTGSLATARSAASRQVLWTGRELVAGGGTSSAELYCPAMPGSVEQWTPTGKLATGRTGHQQTVLDNGKVLISGGTNLVGGVVSTAFASNELYDYITGTFSSAGSMTTPRHQHRNILLPSGKVLITGGQNTSLTGALGTWQLYDPVTNSYTLEFTGGMGSRRLHRPNILVNGLVLVTGGLNNAGGTRNDAALYDYNTNTFTLIANLMTSPRRSHQATRLFDGRVLIVGGRNGAAFLNSAELYDPVLNTFSATANTMSVARSSPNVIRLPTGKVLVVGGTDASGNPLASAELFDPVTNMFSPAGNMSTPREDNRAPLLDNGKILLPAGRSGITDSSVLASAELYDVAAGTFTLTGSVQTARQDYSASPLPNGQTLIAGGSDALGNALASAELYSINICIDDVDGDGEPNATDNAPLVYNPSQSDRDGDGIGDDVDNCPDVANPNQADSNGNGLGDACDDKTLTANFTVPPPPTGVPAGSPLLVNIIFTIDTFTGFVVKPTCENVVHELRGSEGLIPMREFYNVVNIPDDLVAVTPGQQFILTCDVNNLASPGSVTPDTYTYNASIVNQVVDPDIDANGVCTFAPCFPNIFTGQIQSTALIFKVDASLPTVTSVQMDFKFGTFPNDLNPDKKGVTPVVIFGSPTFDVKQINVASLQLSGAPVSPKNNGGFNVSYVDKNGDGIVDLDAKFVTPTRQQLHLLPGQVETTAVLTGLVNGTPFTASDSLRIVKQ